MIDLQIDCPPYYPPGFKAVFVGESPGADEVAAKEGFVGGAGKCLQKAANLAGIEWSTVGKTNISKRRPPNNKFKDCFYETVEEPIYTKLGNLSKKTKKITKPTEEYYEWVALLWKELYEHKPNLIVACGDEALQLFTGMKGITKYRGSILEGKNDLGKVLAIVHPSYIIRGNMVDFWILVHDLKKAKREMERSEIVREPYTAVSNPQHNLYNIFENIEFLRINTLTKWTLDVETRAGTLACFSISYRNCHNGKLDSFCIPIQTTSGPYWQPNEELQIWEAMRELCKKNPNLCNQNIEYDIYYLLRYGIEPSGVYMDTMLAHSILYPEFPKSLDFIASLYLDDVIYWKQDHRDWGDKTQDEALWEYCCKDAVYTLRIVEKIDEELKRRGMWEFYHGGKQ